ncbi:MAG: apolipoprotein N-acyltransferase [Hyphomicrobiales bacterium]
MRAIALKLLALWGWRRALLAVALGAVSALAMAPFNLMPVLLVTFTVLVWLLDGIDAQAGSRGSAFRSGVWLGWCFGFGYFLAGIHWVASAFLVDAETFAWMVPFVLVLFPLMLGTFWALALGFAAAFWTAGISRLLVLAAFLTAAEWLRGHVLTGFPWNTLGLAAAGSDALLQLAAYAGVYGLGFFVILIASAPALLADESTGRGLARHAGTMSFAGLAALFVAFWIGGAYELSNAPVAVGDGPRIRVVQPNIAQKDKWDPAQRSRIFTSYIEMSDAASSPEFSGVGDFDIVVWPESAPPFLLEDAPDALASIAALIPDKAVLVTGALRTEPAPTPGAEKRYFNSVLAIDGTGTVIAHHDKFHLVPFGEYLPFEKLLEPWGLRKLVTMPAGFSAGTAARTVRLPGLPAFSPLVCYEIIFSLAVVDRADRPAWLLNVTNDAWFGDSAGPRQHFQQARLRAIEQGLPVIRAANTGISAVIDARGRVLKQLALGTRGVIDTVLPDAAPPPPYALFGDRILFAIVVLALVLSGLIGWGGRRETVRSQTYTDLELR